jgi:polysaccharide biosynthesis protein PslA
MAILSLLQRAPVADRRSGPPREAVRADRRGPLRPKRLVSVRSRLHGPTVARAFQAGDALAAAAGAFLAHVIARAGTAPEVFFAAPVALICGLTLFRAYGLSRHEPLATHLARPAVATAFAGAVTALAFFPFADTSTFDDALAVWLPTALTGSILLHTAWWLLVRRWRANGRLTPNVVVVGATGAAERLIVQALNRRDANILGVFDDRAARAPEAIRGVPLLGGSDALVGHRVMPFVDRIVITVPSRARKRVRELIGRLSALPNEIVLLLDGQTRDYEDAAISRIADVPLAHICGPPTDALRAAVKRAQDIVIGGLALAAAAPVMALVALAVRLDSRGPALFRQRRHGFNNEEIVVWKFRSMRVEAADATASRQVSADDDRVTQVGRFIRRTSLDELPQLLNVLSGEMSLVGPRPHAVGMKTGDVESARLVAEYAHRHRMKPGLTGWAAIHGSRGPVDTPELVRRRVALDIEYIERQSFWLDLYVLAMTLPCLLGDRSAVR